MVISACAAGSWGCSRHTLLGDSLMLQHMHTGTHTLTQTHMDWCAHTQEESRYVFIMQSFTICRKKERKDSEVVYNFREVLSSQQQAQVHADSPERVFIHNIMTFNKEESRGLLESERYAGPHQQ